MTYTEIDKDTVSVKMYANIGWWGVNARSFTDLLETLDQKYKTIVVRMHCYGGEVFEGNAIANVIDSLSAETIAIVEGVCMSMATILLNKFKVRKACSNAIFMYHAPTGYTMGTAKEHESTVKVLKLMEKNFIKECSERSGQNATDIRELFDGYDHYFDAEEVQKMGLIDEVIEPVVKDVKAIKIDTPEEVDQDALYNRYAAHLEIEEEEEQGGAPKHSAHKRRVHNPVAQPTTVTKNDNYMKKLLIEALALQGVTEQSSDTAILDAVRAVITAKDSEINNFREQAKTAIKAQAEAAIQAAESTSGKKFTDEQKKNLLTVAEKSGLEVFQAMLSMSTPVAAGAAGEAKPEDTGAPQLHTMIGGGNSGSASAKGRESWTFEDWQTKDPDGLEAMANDPKQYEAFNKLYKAAFKVDAPKS